MKFEIRILEILFCQNINLWQSSTSVMTSVYNKLYNRRNCVAMGSWLGSTLTSVFKCTVLKISGLEISFLVWRLGFAGDNLMIFPIMQKSSRSLSFDFPSSNVFFVFFLVNEKVSHTSIFLVKKEICHWGMPKKAYRW